MSANENSPIGLKIGLADVVVKSYWVPSRSIELVIEQLEIVVTGIEVKPGTEHKFRGIIETLVGNLRSVLNFLLLPFGLAREVMYGAMRATSQPPLESEKRFQILENALKSGETLGQLRQMKLQAVLLIWSAYETFSRDIFVSILNADYRLYEQIAKSPLKEKFLSNNIFTFASLVKHDLDVSAKIGSMLADGKDFSSPALLRMLFVHLFPDGEEAEKMRVSVESRTLWILGHRRHLVAHRAGRVDEQYVKLTGDDQQKVGELLEVSSKDLDDAVHQVAIAALCILLSWDSTKETGKISEAVSPVPPSGP